VEEMKQSIHTAVDLLILFLSAANVRKFKADSFVIDDKFNITLAVKRAAETTISSSNLGDTQPEVKRMKTEEPLVEVPSETPVKNMDESQPLETEQKFEESGMSSAS
jgi:hypothetical protein